MTESSKFDLVGFIPLLRERVYSNNQYARQFIISWVSPGGAAGGSLGPSAATTPSPKSRLCACGDPSAFLPRASPLITPAVMPLQPPFPSSPPCL